MLNHLHYNRLNRLALFAALLSAPVVGAFLLLSLLLNQVFKRAK